MARPLSFKTQASAQKTAAVSSNVLAKGPSQLQNARVSVRQPFDLLQEKSLPTEFMTMQSESEMSERIKQLETDWQDLWYHFAAIKKQRLAIQDTNSQLESEICRLKKDVMHETRLRKKAEAKLQILIQDGDCNVDVLPTDSDEEEI